MAYLEPVDRPIYYAVVGAGVAISGQTNVGDATGIANALSVFHDENENDFVGQLPEDVWPDLPDSGWLEVGEIYRYGDGCVMVRQSHNRTHYPPEQTPALFVVYRADAADVLEWVAGESVVVGTRRSYDGLEYVCLQAHVTQSDWTPPATPALWRVVPDEEPTDEWQPWTAYTIGEIVIYQGVEYQCRQSHTSQPGWEPPNVLALWLPL